MQAELVKAGASPLSVAAPFAYQHQDAAMSLREGLAEYHQSFEGLVEENDVSVEAAAFFRKHDTCHVVFGLDTSVRQEVMADIVTIFGVDVKFIRYVGYLKLDAARSVVVDIGKWNLFVESIKAFPAIFRAWRLARRMNKKFPWDEQEPLMDRPLADLRREYGISVPS